MISTEEYLQRKPKWRYCCLKNRLTSSAGDFSVYSFSKILYIYFKKNLKILSYYFNKNTKLSMNFMERHRSLHGEWLVWIRYLSMWLAFGSSLGPFSAYISYFVIKKSYLFIISVSFSIIIRRKFFI